MKKLFTTLSVLALGCGLFTATAQDTFDGASLVLTPDNNAIVFNSGTDAQKTATLYWPGVKFDFNDLSEASGGGYTLDGTKVKITKASGQNGTISPGDMNIGMGGSVVAFKEDDQDYDRIVINFPTVMGYSSYTGNIKVNISEGLVKSSTGQESPEVEFTYVYKTLSGTYTWDPVEAEAIFNMGEPIVLKVNWQTNTITDWGTFTDLKPTVTQQNTSNPVSKEVTEEMLSKEGTTQLQITLTSMNLAPGDYTLTIPSKFVNMSNNRVNGVCNYNFSVLSSVPDPTVTPEDEATVNGFSKVILSWDGVGLKLNPEGASEMTFVLNGEDLLAEYEITPSVEFSGAEIPGYEGDQIVLDLFSLPIEAGEYTLTLPAGFVLVDQNGEAAVNNEFSATYTLEIAYMDNAVVTNTVFADEESYIGLSWGTLVTVTDAENLSITLELDGDNLGSLDAELLSLTSPEELGVENGDSGTILYVPVEYLDPVTYDVKIPAGVLKNAEGKLNPEQTIQVTPIGAITGTVSPSESEAEFEEGMEVEFTITFEEDVTMVESQGDNALVVVNLQGENMNTNYTWANTDVVSVEGSVITVNFGTELEPGDYSFSLNEGVVTTGSAVNMAISDYAFTVVEGETDAISTIGIENSDAAIYNLQGQKVNGGKLVPGIYIINGKKVLVK